MKEKINGEKKDANIVRILLWINVSRETYGKRKKIEKSEKKERRIGNIEKIVD